MTVRKGFTIDHSEISAKDRHPIHSFEFLNETERLEATDFKVEDKYKLAFQLDTQSYWVLMDSTNDVWMSLISGSPLISQLESDMTALQQSISTIHNVDITALTTTINNLQILLDSVEIIVTNVTELEAALAAKRKRIYLKSGPTYNLTKSIAPYSGLSLIGENLPSDDKNTKSDGVHLFYGNDVVIDYSPTLHNIVNAEVQAESKGSSSVNIIVPGEESVTSGSLVIINEKCYLVNNDANSFVDDTGTNTISLSFRDDLGLDHTTHLTTLSICDATNVLRNLTIENISIDDDYDSGSIYLRGCVNVKVNNYTSSYRSDDSLDFVMSVDVFLNNIHTSNARNQITLTSINNFRISSVGENLYTGDHSALNIFNSINGSISNTRGSKINCTSSLYFTVDGLRTIGSNISNFTDCSFFSILGGTQSGNVPLNLINCSDFSIIGFQSDPGRFPNFTNCVRYQESGNSWQGSVQEVIVHDGPELEAALAAKKTKIFMKSGPNYQLTGSIVPYDNLSLVGENTPTDNTNGLEDGVCLIAPYGLPVIVSTDSTVLLNTTIVDDALRGDRYITTFFDGDVQDTFGVDIPVGSIVEFSEGHVYETVEFAASDSTRVAIDGEIGDDHSGQSIIIRTPSCKNLLFKNFIGAGLNTQMIRLDDVVNIIIDNVSQDPLIDTQLYSGFRNINLYMRNCAANDNQDGYVYINGLNRFEFINCRKSGHASLNPKFCFLNHALNGSIRDVRGVGLTLYSSANFEITNCHCNSNVYDSQFVFRYSSYFSVINSSSSGPIPFICNYSNNFMITGCSAPNSPGSEVDISNASAYRIFGNHWQGEMMKVKLIDFNVNPKHQPYVAQSVDMNTKFLLTEQNTGVIVDSTIFPNGIGSQEGVLEFHGDRGYIYSNIFNLFNNEYELPNSVYLPEYNSIPSTISLISQLPVDNGYQQAYYVTETDSVWEINGEEIYSVGVWYNTEYSLSQFTLRYKRISVQGYVGLFRWTLADGEHICTRKSSDDWYRYGSNRLDFMDSHLPSDKIDWGDTQITNPKLDELSNGSRTTLHSHDNIFKPDVLKTSMGDTTAIDSTTYLLQTGYFIYGNSGDPITIQRLPDSTNLENGESLLLMISSGSVVYLEDATGGNVLNIIDQALGNGQYSGVGLLLPIGLYKITLDKDMLGTWILSYS